MNELTTLHIEKKSSNEVNKSLKNALTSIYGLYLATHNYHWNLEKSQFFNLHKAHQKAL